MTAVSRPLRVALLAALASPAALAQGIHAFGDDALVLSRGVARLGFAPTWTTFNQRYTIDGQAEPFGIDFVRETLGVAEFPVLSPVADQLRALSGLSNVRLSFGQTRADVDASILTVPFSAELGIGGRLSLGVVVPIVRTRTQVLISPNSSVTGGNVGINPALESEDARRRNDALISQFEQAAGTLRGLIVACGDPSNTDPRCPQARTPEAAELADAAEAFAGGIADVYDETQGLFVPVSNSALDEAIRARVAGFVESFADFDIADITVAGPMAASILGSADVRRLLTDPAFGIQSEPLGTRTSTSLGDIEIGAKLQLVNTVRSDTVRGSGLRGAIGATFRLGTGSADDPDDFGDVPSGDGQNDIEARTHWDIFLGSRLGLGLAARYVLQLPDREIARIADPHQLFPAFWRRQEVERDLGDIVDVEVTPRIALGDFFSFMAQYRVRRKAEDRHTGRFDVTNDLGDPVTLDASILDRETEQQEDRVSIGLGFSTLASVARGRSRIPLEVFFQYGQSIRGSGGRTPKVNVGVMHVRVYWD
ncbi:MAG: hypothetical protein ACT4PJ_05635 [Gemmatimonadaceae bacterium]